MTLLEVVSLRSREGGAISCAPSAVADAGNGPDGPALTQSRQTRLNPQQGVSDEHIDRIPRLAGPRETSKRDGQRPHARSLHPGSQAFRYFLFALPGYPPR